MRAVYATATWLQSPLGIHPLGPLGEFGLNRCPPTIHGASALRMIEPVIPRRIRPNKLPAPSGLIRLFRIIDPA